VTYPVWIDEKWVDIPVPTMSGEPIIVPNVAAIVRNEDGTSLLLQRRDKPGEPVRGKLEVPGGRWRAGEPPETAVVREIEEETGLEVVAAIVSTRVDTGENRSCAIVDPVAVVSGLEGTYPSLHVLFECTGRGEPRPLAGETADPRWWPLIEVKALLVENPDEFVDQTRAMLVAYFERASDLV
jgi:8-oxo-dGTP diphosphatase